MAMDEAMRALAMKMLGGGALAQAGQAVSPPNRMAQLAAQEQQAQGLPQAAPMQQPPMPQQGQMDPGMLQKLLMLLRSQQSQAPVGP